MRAAMLLLCLPLAACAAGELASEQPAAEAANPPARPAPQAATSPPPAAAADPVRLTQARVDCWMKVEHQKRMRDIDRRIAFVDKCVAEAMKAQGQ